MLGAITENYSLPEKNISKYFPDDLAQHGPQPLNTTGRQGHFCTSTGGMKPIVTSNRLLKYIVTWDMTIC